MRRASARVGASSSDCDFSASRLNMAEQNVRQPQRIVIGCQQSAQFLRSAGLGQRHSFAGQFHQGALQRLNLRTFVFRQRQRRRPALQERLRAIQL